MAKNLNDLNNQIKKEFEEINKELAKTLDDKIKELESVMIAATPVDSGNLRDEYFTYNTYIDDDILKAKIENMADYSDSILLLGRRTVNGKTYGSKQLPQGMIPIIEKWRKQQ